jgi:hypothetical protein
LEITEISQLDLTKQYSMVDYLSWKFKERVELLKGYVAKMSPAPNSGHQIISWNLASEFSIVFKNKPCKAFAAPFDVYLPKNSKSGQTIVQPDLCVICDTSKIEKKGDIHFRDDNKFQFRKMLMENSCLVEKVSDKYITGYKHFYSCEVPFPGYKSIPSGQYILTYNRDIILDLFNKVPEGENLSNKPKNGRDNLKKWISQIAENQRHIYRSKPKSSTMTDKISWALIIVLTLETLGWLFSFGLESYVKMVAKG